MTKVESAGGVVAAKTIYRETIMTQPPTSPKGEVPVAGVYGRYEQLADGFGANSRTMSKRYEVSGPT